MAGGRDDKTRSLEWERGCEPSGKAGLTCQLFWDSADHAVPHDFLGAVVYVSAQSWFPTLVASREMVQFVGSDKNKSSSSPLGSDCWTVSIVLVNHSEFMRNRPIQLLMGIYKIIRPSHSPSYCRAWGPEMQGVCSEPSIRTSHSTPSTPLLSD